MKVVDASCIIDFLISAPRFEAYAHHLDDELFAPELLIAEVHRSLQRLTPPGDEQLFDAHARLLHAADIEFLPSWPYAPQMWQWRHNVSPYDAMYVALAADLGCPLLTADRRLANAVAGIVPVICV